MQLRYAFRLYPTGAQRAALARAFGCARVVFNDGLRAREDARAAGAPVPSAAELSRRLTEAKRTPERAWLREVSAVVLQQALRDLDAAYRAFFAGLAAGGPRFGAPRLRRRRDSRQSIRFTNNAGWAITDGGRLRLPKVGDLKMKWSRRLPSAPSSVTVVQDAAGRCFASFVAEVEPGRSERTDSAVGVDLGLHHFAVLSDGTAISAPRFLRRAEKRLRRAQRALARKQPGSRNREKARGRVAREHVRVADRRRDFHHQVSTALIRENQTVAVEDLAVGALARTWLAKSVHDAGWSAFVRMPEYKARKFGRTLVRIDRFAPTSQVCSACGVRDGRKPLRVRAWTCPACGVHHDRDVNAARNIATAAGPAVSACGAPTRRAFGPDGAVKQEPAEAVARPRQGTRRGSTTPGGGQYKYEGKSPTARGAGRGPRVKP
ncbi:RNA-guided endonuclease InsQ/TnpB family protein [Kitasatospora cineracea]|uniref:RNA-guided endonuclease InsQ/TnpB family protein n=1 Tax=Kitasatospora cineracea TaxID=88074 RepID=UPI0037B0CA1F